MVIYKFIIKKSESINLENLFINRHKINYNFLKKMPENLRKNYNVWAIENFGYDYNAHCHCVHTNDTLEIEIECNKNCLKVEPWFEKFKDNIDIYMIELDCRKIDPLGIYTHYFYSDGIKFETQSEQRGKELKKILLKSDSEIKEYFISEFDMPQEFKDKDIEYVVNIFISIYPSLFKYLSEKYKNNREFVLKAVQNNCLIYNFLEDKKLLCDREIIITVIMSNNKYKYNDNDYYNPDLFSIIKSNYEDDRELVKVYISKNKSKFKYFANKYGDDKEIALLSLESEIYSKDNFNYFSCRLKEDIDIVKEFSKYDLFENKDIREKYKNDLDFIKCILSFKGTEKILSRASDTIRNSEEIINLLLEDNYKLFEYVGDKCKKDKEICLSVLRKDSEMIKYVDIKLLKNKDFCTKYINILKRQESDNFSYHNGWREILQYIDNKSILYDRKFVIEAIKNGACLWFPNKIFMNYIDDEEIMIYALICDNFLYHNLPDKYRDNDIYTIAALTNYDYIKSIKDFSFNEKELYKLLNNEYKLELKNKNLYNSFLHDAGSNIRYASNRIRNDLKFAKYAVSQTKGAYIYIGKNIINNPEIKCILNGNSNLEKKSKLKLDIKFKV